MSGRSWYSTTRASDLSTFVQASSDLWWRWFAVWSVELVMMLAGSSDTAAVRGAGDPERDGNAVDARTWRPIGDRLGVRATYDSAQARRREELDALAGEHELLGLGPLHHGGYALLWSG